MNKYFGKIGYETTEEIRPSVWLPKIVERSYYGDVLKSNFRRDQPNDQVNDNIRMSVRLSIIADEGLIDHASKIKYAEYLGEKWNVTDIEPAHPRLILTIGDVYTGEEITT